MLYITKRAHQCASSTNVQSLQHSTANTSVFNKMNNHVVNQCGVAQMQMQNFDQAFLGKQSKFLLIMEQGEMVFFMKYGLCTRKRNMYI